MSLQPFEPPVIFPFLSLPLSLRHRIYTHLLVPFPPPSTIDLYYTWSFSGSPRLRFNQCGPYGEGAILLTNKQIHTEGSDLLYSRAKLRLRCDESLRVPFAQWPLRDVGEEAPFKVRGTHMEGDKLRRFGTVRIVWLMGFDDFRQPDLRDIMYSGDQYGYSPTEMAGGIQGLKQVLGALAVGGSEKRGALRDVDDAADGEGLERAVLELELEWAQETKVKRCPASGFNVLWTKQGIWDVLKEVEKVRTIRMGGSAHREFGRQWL